MPEPLPDSAPALRTLVTDAGTVEVSLVDVAVREPRPDQVVVRVEAAPINPSDLGLLFAGADLTRATAGGTADHPVITAPLTDGAARAAAARLGQSLPAGNEGAGTVVAAGESAEAQALLGNLVAVAGGSMYARYRVTGAAACLELPDGVSAAQGAAALINPLTALGMIETMRGEGHSALVHTAAASNLGRMLHRICTADHIPLVNIVRSPAQVDLLRGAGAQWVCDSTSQTFLDDLVIALAATSATIAFDAVGGGNLASRILTAMEIAITRDAEFSRYGSEVHKQVYIYGGLDRGPTDLTRGYGMAWGVGGWLLTPFLARAGSATVAALRERVAREITTTFASEYTAQISLADALRPDIVADYGRQATGRKYLITP